jgi:hypothetical protein
MKFAYSMTGELNTRFGNCRYIVYGTFTLCLSVLKIIGKVV